MEKTLKSSFKEYEKDDSGIFFKLDRKLTTKIIKTFISENEIIYFLSLKDPIPCSRFNLDGEHSLYNVVPEIVPEKLLLSKMKSLIKRGLISGCGCGCRGDFILTEKGKNYLNDALH